MGRCEHRRWRHAHQDSWQCPLRWDFCAYDEVDGEHVHACYRHLGQSLSIGGRWVLEHGICVVEASTSHPQE